MIMDIIPTGWIERAAYTTFWSTLALIPMAWELGKIIVAGYTGRPLHAGVCLSQEIGAWNEVQRPLHYM